MAPQCTAMFGEVNTSCLFNFAFNKFSGAMRMEPHCTAMFGEVNTSGLSIFCSSSARIESPFPAKAA